MDGSWETAAIRAVQDRLYDQFSYLGEEVVAAAVQHAQDQLNGPIRDFVPVLVERNARIRLAAMTSHADPIAPRKRRDTRSLVP